MLMGFMQETTFEWFLPIIKCVLMSQLRQCAFVSRLRKHGILLILHHVNLLICCQRRLRHNIWVGITFI